MAQGVRAARLIDASEALVVSRHTANKVGEPHVERRVVLGPARFIPSADEWVHEFEWSGVPQDGSKTTYQPKALRFTKLRVIPASAYHNVSEVRTNCDGSSASVSALVIQYNSAFTPGAVLDRAPPAR